MTVATARQQFGFGLFTLGMLAVFIGLGVWQLERRVEKHALIAVLTERLAIEPVPLPPRSAWNQLTAQKDEFRRVRFKATYEAGTDAMVYSSGSAIRDDISGPGTWAFVPARLSDGDTVVVNAGFVQNMMQDRTVQDRAVSHLVTGKPADLTGYIRFPQKAGMLTPAANPAKRLWFTRDHLEMSPLLGWGDVAPFYIDLEQPVPPSGIPLPGPLHVHLKDDHMQYAITWFALAGAVLIAFFVWWRGKRRNAA
ncbi:SURF1 family cytochrome oxidase biogenesis protein [Bradyrhizobium sp.]|uniref:SURF1 family protein n=1 Tax=Bradyrhizobium sp. TaxID=376 RepID=UPI002604ED3D|nr:SURF1 family cytochrome oxidase biogenesis protein [Bradyrhizobium sp.]